MSTNGLTIDQLIPGGVRPSDHWHRRTNDRTCSRCRKEIEDDEVPLMLWSNDGEDMLIYCEACLGGLELKPCPFCGSAEVSISRNTWGDGREGRYVECGACEAASGSWPIGEATAERAAELAVRKWNRRAEPLHNFADE